MLWLPFFIVSGRGQCRQDTEDPQHTSTEVAMARPRKEGMNYFPHDVDSSNDEKIEAMTGAFGAAGYAFYFILLERIFRSSSFELAIPDEATIKILAKKCLTTPKMFMPMLAWALKVGLFDNEAYTKRRVLTSDGIKKRTKPVIDKRIRMWGSNAHGSNVPAGETPPEMDATMTQSKAEGTGDHMKDKEQGSKADDQTAYSSRDDEMTRQSNDISADGTATISDEMVRRLAKEISELITQCNAESSDRHWAWRSTTGSFEADLRKLLLGFPVERRGGVLDHAYSISGRRRSWFDYVDSCVRFVVTRSGFGKIKAHFKYTYDMLKHPERFIFPV